MKNKRDIFIIVIISILMNIYIHRTELFGRYVVYPDIFIFYWLNYVFSACPANDPSVYIINSLPVRLNVIFNPVLSLNALLSRFFPLSILLTIQSAVYSSISALLIFFIGQKIRGNRGHAYPLVILFFVYTATMDTFFAGQTRGIGFILVCACFYSLLIEKPGFLLFLAAACLVYYPFIVPMVLCIFAYSNRKAIFREKPVAVLSAFFYCLGLYFLKSRSFFTGFMNWKFIFKSHDPNTTHPIVMAKLFLSNFVLNFNEHSGFYAYFTFFLLAVFFVFFFRDRENRLTNPEKEFIAGSLIAFVLMLPLNAGIASRQISLSIPIFLLIFAWRNIANLNFRQALPVFSAVFLFTFMVFNSRAHDLSDLNKYSKLFEYASSSGKENIFAGHPDTLEYIPFFTGRQVFYNKDWEKLSVFIPKNIKSENKKKKERLLKALYALRREELLGFVADFKFDYFIIDEYYYSEEYLGRASNRPDLNVPDIGFGRSKPDFLLLDYARNYGVVISNGIYLLKSSALNNND